MQYKKQVINDKILEAGRDEYATKGFRNGNISAVAERAGVPVGNLYRYFDGKAGLLDAIVKPTYLEVPKMIAELQNFDVLDSITLEQIMPLLTDRLLGFFEKCGKEILILVDQCASTRYEDFSHDIIKQVSEIVCRKLYSCPTETDKKMAYAIAKAFMNSLYDLLRLGLSRDEMQQMMIKLIKFYFFDVEKRK